MQQNDKDSTKSSVVDSKYSGSQNVQREDNVGQGLINTILEFPAYFNLDYLTSKKNRTRNSSKSGLRLRKIIEAPERSKCPSGHRRNINGTCRKVYIL